jgi:hypothetical protein
MEALASGTSTLLTEVFLLMLPLTLLTIKIRSSLLFSNPNTLATPLFGLLTTLDLDPFLVFHYAG